MSRPIVIYHSSCVDGWCAAWIFDRCLHGAELLPAHYGDEPPNVDGREVYVLDFSYPRQVMIEMHKSAHSLWVLDHHATAEEACADLPFCIFDKEQSGAGLAYWWCYDQGWIADLKATGEWRDIASGMSTLSQYVQDRDLFRFALDASEAVNAAIRSYSFELEVWDYLSRRCHVTPLSLVGEGEAIQRYRKQITKSHVGHSHIVEIAGVHVPAVLCATGDIISDVCGELAKGELFAATYCPTSEGDLLVSLRSEKNGLDVGQIAKEFGGGGHKHAAGFKLPYQYLVRLSTKHGIKAASKQA
jgi:oligoribonuclease NrnB/cAMP/cGMP phosphodiesterase (DHH superfamily)